MGLFGKTVPKTAGMGHWFCIYLELMADLYILLPVAISTTDY